jgi:hypothetical protein
MSEDDLDLKLAARRLAWCQGYATRVNVPLRSYVEKRAGRPGYQEYTDLDLLAISTTASGRVESQIFDCKSTTTKTTERTFWLRGVADFFGATDAWMLRPAEVTDASRQLASKLQLGVLTKNDLEVLTAIAAGGDSMGPAIERLFDVGIIGKIRTAFSTLDKRLHNLNDYISYDYWVYEPYQNLAQMVAHLRSAARYMDGRSPVHTALLFDCIWLYVHSLAHASDYIRRTNAGQVYSALLEYFLGGQVAIREKELEPEYFRPLAETLTRMYVRRGVFTAVMRYCEVASANLIDGRRPYLSSALGGEYDEIVGKLMYDVAAFLISNARLAPSFRESVRTITLGIRKDGNTERDSHAHPSVGNESKLQLSFDEDGASGESQHVNSGSVPPVRGDQ